MYIVNIIECLISMHVYAVLLTINLVLARNNTNNTSDYANKLNLKTRFDASIDEDGYYDPNTKEIVINPNSKLGELSTLVHEITHSTEGSKFYGALSEIVEKNYVGDISKAIADIKTLYGRYGVNLDDDGAKKEFIAKQAQRLLGDEGFVKKLVRYNESLAYRLYRNIKGMTNSDVKTQLENNFMKAFNDIQTENKIESIQIDNEYKNTIRDFIRDKSKIPNTKDTIKIDNNSAGLDFAQIDENIGLEISGETLYKTFLGTHKDKIPDDVVINLKEELKNKSVLAIEGFGKNIGKTAVFLESIDKDKNPIIVAIELSKQNGRNNIVNEVVSIHGRDKIQNMLYNAYKHNAQIFTNEKSDQWLRANGLSLPNAGSLVASKNNISNSNDNVKDFSIYSQKEIAMDKGLINRISSDIGLDLSDRSIAITSDNASLNNISNILNNYDKVSFVNDKGQKKLIFEIGNGVIELTPAKNNTFVVSNIQGFDANNDSSKDNTERFVTNIVPKSDVCSDE